MELITFLGYLLLRRAVLLLVILGGIVFALGRWKRHPRVSLLTTIGLGLYLVESYAFAFLFHYLLRLFDTLHLSASNISMLDSGLQLADDFGFSVVLILLVAAAFSRRNRSATN
jgi:cbb3-type cytochrome oxidase subunit 3